MVENGSAEYGAGWKWWAETSGEATRRGAGHLSSLGPLSAGPPPVIRLNRANLDPWTGYSQTSHGQDIARIFTGRIQPSYSWTGYSQGIHGHDISTVFMDRLQPSYPWTGYNQSIHGQDTARVYIERIQPVIHGQVIARVFIDRIQPVIHEQGTSSYKWTGYSQLFMDRI
jgi:hypothetical protein